jgi:hypothetical protein
MYNEEIKQKLIESIKVKKNYVIPNGKKWICFISTKKEEINTFNLKSEAVKYAESLNLNVKIYVFNGKGTKFKIIENKGK